MTKLKTEDLPGGIVLHLGDCLEVMAELPDNSVDSCVTDPPYHLASIVKRYAKGDAKTERSIRLHGEQKVSPFMRGARGFMGKKWDGGDVAFRVETWRQVCRVMKPGAYLVAFGGTRTYHRMACAIEDAGFEVRDMISWMYGSGFPKSHDLSKGIDRALGVKGTYAEPKSDAHAGWIDRGRMRGGEGHEGWQSDWMDDPEAVDRNARRYIPASPEAQAFVGFGTAIKPACEPIALARKPLSEKTVAANVLKWGTGALNIDACRIATDETIEVTRNVALGSSGSGIYGTAEKPGVYEQNKNGRWPANVVHDGSPEVVAAFPDSAPSCGSPKTMQGRGGIFGGGAPGAIYSDDGSAARFFANFPLTDDDRKWQHGLESRIGPAKSAGECLSLQDELVVSALNNAVAISAVKQQLKKQSYRALNTVVSEHELNLICASVTEATQNLERRCALGFPLANFSAKLDRAISVAIPKPTGTMTIMINLSRSGRFVEVATFDTIAMNEEVGAPGFAKRFHYTAKADNDDRLGSKHPTVKPIDLIQWLVRLVTPPKGCVLDPFAGTGTAAEAAIREGMHAWLIEREPEYQDDIRRRMRLAFSGPLERTHESIKAKYKDRPVDNGPLFGGTTDAA